MVRVRYTAGPKEGQTEDVSPEKKRKLEEFGTPHEVLERGNPNESGDGVDVDEFAKSESQFLTADMVSEGDIIKVLGAGVVDDETWDTERLILPVEHKGQEYSLSIGKRNAQRIADGYGAATSGWIGKDIRVVSIENYPQINSKGMFLKPTEHAGEM